MTLRRKLLTAYGALALLSLLIAAMTLWAIVQWGSSNDALQDHYQRSLQLQRIRASAFRAFKEVPDAVTGGDDDARQEFSTQLAPIDEDFATWEELAQTDDEREQVRLVREAYDAIVADSRAVFDLVDQGRPDEAFALMEGRLEDERFAPFEEVTEGAVASDRATRGAIRDQVERTRRTAQIVVGLAAFGTVSLTLLIAAYLASDLFGPLRALRGALGDAAGGNFDVRLDAERHDEFGETNGAFNRMAEAFDRRQRAIGIADAAPADGADGGGAENWQAMPSRVVLHSMVARLRHRVADLAESSDGATGPNGEGRGNEQTELVAELDQLSLAVARLADFGFPLDLNLARTDVRALLYEVLLRFHDDFARRAISFEVDIGPDVGEATVDRLKLREALGELVRNALAALPEQGGRLGLRASVAADGTELVLEVADDGAGAEQPLINEAFAPFSASRRHHAGVGLTLTKAIVEQHGGKLDIASEPGEGTHVRISLPLRD